MAKRKIDLSGFLSEDTGKISNDLNSQIVESKDIQISDNLNSQIANKSKRKIYKFVGFYLSQENLVKLKEMELLFLKNGEKLDRSDIVNKAISSLHGIFFAENENKK